VDERDVDLLGSDGEGAEVDVVLAGDCDVLVYGVVPAVHVDVAFLQVVEDLVVWVRDRGGTLDGEVEALF
jgi:hypothetical protein